MIPEVAKRYAVALYDAAAESKSTEKIFEELRTLQAVFSKDKSIHDFIFSPSITASVREQTFAVALEKLSLSSEAKGFLTLLAKKNRLRLFDSIVEAYEAFADERHGVTRGSISSAATLGPEDRRNIETKISEFIKKRVIFNYREDAGLIGGLVAEVGSFNFDDSLKSHLERLREDLTRRTQ